MPDKPASSWSERTFAKRRNRRIYVLGAVVACAVAALIIGTLLLSAPETPLWTPKKYVKAERGAYREVLMQNGKVEASNVRTVFNRVTGIITWMIEEGSVVDEGVEIVRIDDSDTVRRLEDFVEQRYKPGQFALESNMQTFENKRAELEISVKLAEINVQQAELALRELHERYQDELEVALLDAEIAELEAESAQFAVDVNKPLSERGIVAENVLSALTVDALNAQAVYEENKERVQRLQEGPTVLELRAAQTVVASARENLQTRQYMRDADMAIHEADVAHARAQLDRLEIEKRRQEEEIRRCSVRAPVPGAVVYVNVWKGSNDLSPIHVGETRGRGADLLKMADTSSLEVHMLVGEPDALLVSEGQKAQVRFVAFPELVLPATVTYVSPDAQDKNQKLGSLALAKLGQAGVKSIDVHLTLDKNDPRTRLGLSAEVEIEIMRLEDALLVPTSAITFGKDGAWCWRKVGSTLERVPVKIERWNGTEAVISDVKEGDELLDAPLVHGYN